MPLNALAQEVLSIPGIPDSGSQAALVGDVVSFIPAIGPLGTLTVTLARKPAGSSATVSSNTVTPDVAGLYTVTVTNANQTRTVSLFAFPSSGAAAPLLQRVQPANTSSRLVGRTDLTCLVNSGPFNFAPLEQSPPTLVGVCGSGGVPWTLFGSP
jgi:hypothetical protein